MNEVLPYVLSDRAAKTLKRIRKTDRTLYEKMLAGIMAIRLDPNVGEPKKGDLKGYSSLDISHMRTNYELCYKLELNENGDVVLIVLMGPRENFYDDLKRYLNL
ncbi:type II toxin-antitoxin system RelE/ParE family toxin [Neobacillus sp. OS1-2]|uniref:type II toxin-antitoxin system RelE/ParE family toxin n=1 Tax=Neobacillus sp. OS1-2 TaxID=3070680 RepID=UPI0027E1E9DF|nr:type II toxin-antitoxin system RelE/ParE family toxin [Neobacillus sp. OS1-2]WML42073.1 type II toxin-antitoxin system RelE/ParE family toxin [Neobacillus sp. OS1-2]